MLASLAEAGFRAVAPFLRGYAPSPLSGPFDVDALASDVVAMADALSPDAPIAIVGHDWGAIATYGALALRPDRFTRAVTLAVPHPLAFLAGLRKHPMQLRRSWYMLAFQAPLAERLVVRDDFALIERLWRDWSPSYDPSPLHLSRLKLCLAASMPAPIELYRALFRPAGEALRRIERAGRADQRIRVPTLQLHGERDGCIGAELFEDQARYFAGERERHMLRGVGHFLHLEAPAEVFALVLDWLRRDGAAGGGADELC